MNTACAEFAIGQRVHHQHFDYRGVIVDVDPNFQGSEEWYEQVALSRPQKNKPWYRVLVHDANYETYVAERHLEPDDTLDPIEHPLVQIYFTKFQDGTYIPARASN